MRPLKTLIPISEVQEIINQKIHSISEFENISLLELNNRVLAEDIIAPFHIPPFDRAAMDGYAVKAEDIKNVNPESPVLLECIDRLYAGDEPKKSLLNGQCIEIATGAMIPEGADCVVQVEETKRNEGKIAILKAFPMEWNISFKGSDIKKGELILSKGTRLNPAKIGVLASLNIASCKVYRKPKVAIIPTGREVVKLGDVCHPGQIYDINSYTIFTMVVQACGEPILYNIVPDEYAALEQAILDATAKADLTIIIGGSSVGERDINIDILNAHGTILFHGIKIKPGKPTIAAILNDRLMINLPGFPTSCLTIGYMLVYPIVQKMAHFEPEIKKTRVILGERVKSTPGRDLLLTMYVKDQKAYRAFKESSAITSIAQADGYIVVPCDVPFIDQGAEVELIYF